MWYKPANPSSIATLCMLLFPDRIQENIRRMIIGAGGAGGADVLLAYPLLGPSIVRWFDLMDRFPESRLSVTVDSEAALSQLESHARKREKQVDLFVDIDNGMPRTGIDPESARKQTGTLLVIWSMHFLSISVRPWPCMKRYM